MPNIPTDRCDATTIERAGQRYLSFGGCNYLGLAHDPRVIQAAHDAASRYGLSSSASRETTGNARPHARLEAALTNFCAHRAGLLVPDGYTANLATLQGLEALGVRHALIDARAHASLKDAARLGGMGVTPFDHLDADHAAELIAKLDAPAAVLTDSVFTTDGDLAPAQRLLSILRQDDWLILDDCHGFGVLGDRGRGAPDELRLSSEQLIVTTTLAKGLGCAGGMVMGPSRPVEAARTRSIAYRCTTPASPALVAAGLTALEIVSADDQLQRQLRSNILRVRTVLDGLGLEPHGLPTPIFAFTVGTVAEMERIEGELLQAGIILPLMAYPNGPAPMYFRLSVNARHTPEHIDRLGQALAATVPQQHSAGAFR